jgi:hypothetical protein
VNIVIGVRMNAGERKMDNTREREKECRKGRNSKRMYECTYVSFRERERRKEMQRRIYVCERERKICSIK